MKQRILIIDDETDFCFIMKNFFSKKGYDVSLAYTLKEGMTILKEFRPHILFLDNNLPDGMGWIEAENIHRKFPKMNITLISAYQTPKDFKAHLSMTINILEKPISLNDIEKYL